MITLYFRQWRRMFNFSDRSSVHEFWVFILINTLIEGVLLFFLVTQFTTVVFEFFQQIQNPALDLRQFGNLDDQQLLQEFDLEISEKMLAKALDSAGILYLWTCLSFIATLSLAVRRLNDRKMTIAFLGFIFIPVFGWIILLIILSGRSHHSSDDFLNS